MIILYMNIIEFIHVVVIITIITTTILPLPLPTQFDSI
jgi:hypothetical protein